MIQKVIDHLYRYPLSNWKKIQRFGGYVKYCKMVLAKKQMEKASKSLSPILSYNDGYPIYFLTGKNFLYQTLFCSASLIKFSSEKFQFILVDDGSFNEELILRINRQMPGAEIITKEIINQNLNKILPEENFPYLNFKRKIYPHIKKLTDIHTIANNKYKLVLDSDMLFWSEPTEVINWLKKPDGALHMIDCDEAYGYSAELMQILCNYQIPKLVNVGAFGLQSNSIDWKNLEYWSKTLEEKEGASYFLEQALSAMIIANQNRVALNKKTYIVNPKNGEEEYKVLGHYVDISKQQYILNAWKKVTY